MMIGFVLVGVFTILTTAFLILGLKVSMKSEKFVEGECEKMWDDMDDEGLGMGSLYRWARDDNPAKFNELSKDNLQKCMLDSLSQTPNDVARVVHHMYKHEFVCASSKRNVLVSV